jgi:hypothetical protein
MLMTWGQAIENQTMGGATSPETAHLPARSLSRLCAGGCFLTCVNCAVRGWRVRHGNRHR